jgi:hypothetical protein
MSSIRINLRATSIVHVGPLGKGSKTMPEQVRAAMAPKRPVKRLVATIFMVALSFCAICGKVLLDARRAAWDNAAQVARRV